MHEHAHTHTRATRDSAASAVPDHDESSAFGASKRDAALEMRPAIFARCSSCGAPADASREPAMVLTGVGEGSGARAENNEPDRLLCRRAHEHEASAVSASRPRPAPSNRECLGAWSNGGRESGGWPARDKRKELVAPTPSRQVLDCNPASTHSSLALFRSL